MALSSLMYDSIFSACTYFTLFNRLQESFPSQVSVPVCALSEIHLQSMSKKKLIDYNSGDSAFTRTSAKEVDNSLLASIEGVLQK